MAVVALGKAEAAGKVKRREEDEAAGRVLRGFGT